MERYELYLLLHIVGAVIWVGGGLLFVLQSTRAERHLDGGHISNLLDDVKAFGNPVFVPASLLVLVMGILMVADGPWSFGELWIVLALAGFAATFLNGVLFLEPTSARVRKLVDRDGGMSPEALTAVRRLLAISRADEVLLFAIIAVMVIKPTGGDMGVLVALAAVVLAALGYAVWRVQSLSSDAAPAAPAGVGGV